MINTKKRNPLFAILLVNFTGTLGFSIVLPFLVFLVMNFGGDAVIYSILAATYPAFQLIGSPILGRWSDIYGRKKVLLLSNVGTAIGWILFVIALALPIDSVFNINLEYFGAFVVAVPLVFIFLARAIDGVTGGNISVANAYLSDISTDKNRSNNFGKMAISSNLGFILGPALAGILGGTFYGALLPVLAALLLSIVTLIVIGFLLRESIPKSNQILIPEKGTIRKVFAQECKDCYPQDSAVKSKFGDVFKLEHISFLLVLYFLIFLGFNVYYASFPTHAANVLHWSVTQLGIFYAVLSGIMVFIQGPVLRKALKKFSEEKLVIFGSLILGVNFVLFFSESIISVYIAVVLFAIGNGLMWPSFMSILSKRAGTDLQGAVQGVAGSIGGVASIIGLIVGGVLYNLTGGATFLVSAVIIFSVFVMSFRLLKR
ncbi:MAG TPA: MFS transporter [Nitrososphaeraceae archaeon]|jgi:MFS family permease|nr:MFS transporter [Nitrososphaeraceae archaeon]